MSNPRSILPMFLCALLIPAGLPATAAAASTTGAAPADVSQARLGRGFGSRSPGFGSRFRSRPRYPSRSYRRPFGARRFFGGVLKALGVAYLFHLMFGWGAGGGSPFGLLLLAAIVLMVVTRRRRRRALYY